VNPALDGPVLAGLGIDLVDQDQAGIYRRIAIGQWEQDIRRELRQALNPDGAADPSYASDGLFYALVLRQDALPIPLRTAFVSATNASTA
jgi:hypothetical protein